MLFFCISKLFVGKIFISMSFPFLFTCYPLFMLLPRCFSIYSTLALDEMKCVSLLLNSHDNQVTVSILTLPVQPDLMGRRINTTPLGRTFHVSFKDTPIYDKTICHTYCVYVIRKTKYYDARFAFMTFI